MSARPIPLRILLCSTTLVAGLGCSGQPSAPSSVPSAAALPAGAVAAPLASPPAVSAASRFGERTPGTVYVTSQGLYYDTFATADPLPMQGRFQSLSSDGKTEFGPGQRGYLGGRWWVDVNENGVQDEGDHFFLCPLLPPGRPSL